MVVATPHVLKLTAAACLQQSEPRRGSSKTRRDKGEAGCSMVRPSNPSPKRKHHCKRCVGAVSPGRAEANCWDLHVLHSSSQSSFHAHRPPGFWTLLSKKAGPGGPKGSSLGASACWTRLLIPLAHGQTFPPHDVTSLLVTVALPASFWTVFCPWVVGSQVPLSCRSSVRSALSSRLRMAGRAVSAKRGFLDPASGSLEPQP